jgi:hypothetical protein
MLTNKEWNLPCETAHVTAILNVITKYLTVNMQRHVARILLYLRHFPSHMKICVNILKYFLFILKLFYITVTLRVSTDMAIIRCFEIAVKIAALPSVSSNPKYILEAPDDDR